MNLAVFFELFYIENKNKVRLIVLIIALITTFSTTGYIALASLVVIYALSKWDLKKLNFKLISQSILLIICLIIGFNLMPDIIKLRVFGKLGSLFNGNNNQYDTTSLDVRTNSIEIAINAFISNPIFGIGFTRMSNIASSIYNSLLTMTPLDWFGFFGAFVGILMNYPLYLGVKVADKRKTIRIMLLIFLILIFATENYNRNSFIICFLFMGYKIKQPYIKEVE